MEVNVHTTKYLKQAIKELSNHRKQLVPYSVVEQAVYNDILKLKSLYPCDQVTNDVLEILVISYVNMNMGYDDILNILEALEDTNNFRYDQEQFENIYNKVKK